MWALLVVKRLNVVKQIFVGCIMVLSKPSQLTRGALENRGPAGSLDSAVNSGKFLEAVFIMTSNVEASPLVWDSFLWNSHFEILCVDSLVFSQERQFWLEHVSSNGCMLDGVCKNAWSSNGENFGWEGRNHTCGPILQEPLSLPQRWYSERQETRLVMSSWCALV